jgi:MFS family permease
VSAPSQAGTPSRRLPAILRALEHRNYRLFFTGQLISLTGSWMQIVGQGWLVLRLTDSAFLLGVVAVASSLPALLFSLPAGMLADRLPKRGILLLTQSIAMTQALTMAVLTLSGVVQVWHVLLLAMLLGCVQAFDAPARQSFTIEMVGREDLLNAIALNSTIFNTARTLGPAVAGIAVALLGEGLVFLYNGISYAAVLTSLLLMRLPRFTPPPRRRQGEQLREGLGYIVQEPRVFTLLLLAGTLCMFGLVYFHLLPVFARDVFHTDASGLGWLSAASGSGALLAALSLAQFGERLPRGRLLVVAMLLFPLFLIAFTFTRSLPLAMLCMALVGWAAVSSLALSNTLIQSIVPDALRARIMSVFTMLLLGMGPVGSLLAGGVAQLTGDVTLVVACSAGFAWGIVLSNVLLEPRLRRL